MRRLLIALLVGLHIAAWGQTCDSFHPTTQAVTAVPQAWSKSAKTLLGASTLYFHDDDAAWHSIKEAGSLRASGVTTLRFPGGEVADDYDWETNLQEKPTGWPGRPDSSALQLNRTDFRELLAHASDNGIESLFFVVNVDGAFRAKGAIDANLEAYANRAAAWVRAAGLVGKAKIHWEIGNEPYLPNSSPLTANEYAHALKIYANAIRSVDPAAQIGAAGPSGWRLPGFADRLTPLQLKKLRDVGGHATRVCKRQESAKNCLQRFRALTGEKLPQETPAWWEVLAQKAGDSFNFVILHQYELAQLPPGTSDSTPTTKRLRELRSWLEERLGRPVPLAVTEWNTPNQDRKGTITDAEHLAQMVITMGSLASAGVEHAHYWPMRTSEVAFRALLRPDGKPTHRSVVMKWTTELIQNTEIAQYLPMAGVYVLGGRSPATSAGLLVNTLDHVVPVLWPRAGRATAWALETLASHDPDTAISMTMCRVKADSDGMATIFLAPMSVSYLKPTTP